MNNTMINDIIDDLTPIDCSDDDLKFYISLGGNIILGLFTIVSEFLPYSKCKSNGILQTTEHIVRNITKRDLTNNEETNSNV